MATLYSAHGAQNVDDQWCDADDGVQDTTAQAADDLIIHDVAAAVVFNTDLTANSLTVTTGSFTLDGDRTLTGDFDLDGGTLVAGAYALRVDGDFIRTSGTGTGTGVWTQGISGNLAWADATNRIPYLSLAAGITSTLTANAYLNEFTMGAGSTLAGAFFLFLYVAGNDKWHQGDGAITCDRLYLQTADDYEIGALDATGITSATRPVIVQATVSDKTLTMTGDWDCTGKDVEIHTAANNQYAGLAANGNRFICRDVKLGYVIANGGGGRFDCGGGIITVRSIFEHADSDATEDAMCVLACASAYIICSGTIDGDKSAASPSGEITVTNTACHVQGGTVQNVNNGSTEGLHTHGSSAGAGGNTNVTFDTHVAPGSLSATGAGI